MPEKEPLDLRRQFLRRAPTVIVKQIRLAARISFIDLATLIVPPMQTRFSVWGFVDVNFLSQSAVRAKAACRQEETEMISKDADPTYGPGVGLDPFVFRHLPFYIVPLGEAKFVAADPPSIHGAFNSVRVGVRTF